MPISRRRLLRQASGAAAGLLLRPSLSAFGSPQNGITGQVAPGPYSATRASLQAYTIPDWFADAKFGIWAHWGPQSAIGDGDWYARLMYEEGSDQYNYHRQRFGPQSKFGYKDCIPLFTADKWDPDHLMDLYVKAGAKYFFSMGVHHDNYDLWNSKYQPHWNAMATGPRKDVVGLWAAAARRRGLRFGVSEHLSNSFNWLSPSHLADTKGEYAGVPYDGANPEWKALYHDYSDEPSDYAQLLRKTDTSMSRQAPERWKMQYFRRIKDLVDQHQPDLLYTDGGIPFDELGLATVAELYNIGPVDSRGNAEAVYFSKTPSDCLDGTCALDRERGVLDAISPKPWQTDTCIGQWHYKVGQPYKTPKKVIDLLVDIVSKNGNLLLNFPLPASGELDPREIAVLEGITAWMRVNGEGIFHTRPWSVNGEGPAMAVVIAHNGKEFDPNEGKKPDLTAKDIRYTRKGQTLFAFVQGRPQEDVVLEALGTASAQKPGKVVDVRMLGRDDQALRFTQTAQSLRVTMPGDPPATAEIGVALRIRFA